MKQMLYVESITEDYKDWRKDVLNHKIMSDFLNANGILFEDLFSFECKREADIIVGNYEINLSKVVLFKKKYITNKLYKIVNIESGLENICKFLINYNNISKPVTYENIIYGMGLNLTSFTDIEDKKGLKIQDYLRKKHFKEMKQFNMVENIKEEISKIAKEKYGDFKKDISNYYYSQVTKYEFDDNNYIEFSVERDYLGLIIRRNGECICHELYHRLDLIKDEGKVFNLILKELNNVTAKHSI